MFHCYFCVELGKGVASTVGHSLLLLHHYLLSWTDVSNKLCIKLVNEGHLMQHFFEIKELSNSLAEDKVRMYVCMHVCMYVCVHEYTYVCTVCTYVCMHQC